jgi:hypothetical protein
MRGGGISSSARNESRAAQGPSPSILSLTGRGEERDPGFFAEPVLSGVEGLQNDTKK